MADKTQRDFLLKYAAMALAAVTASGNTGLADAQENATNKTGQGAAPAPDGEAHSSRNALNQGTWRTEQLPIYLSVAYGPPPPRVTGPLTSQTIVDDIYISGSSLGKQGSIFVAAFVRDKWFAMNSSSVWSAWNGVNADFPSYSNGVLQTTTVTFANAMDLSGLVGTSLYIGFGVGSALSPPGTTFANMLENGTYIMSYVIR